MFSQYTSFLDIIEWRLKKTGMQTVKLVGSMPMEMRTSVLNAFRHRDDVSVILLSLKAGGEGLNLQAASHVLIADPWWNGAVEAQAIQRAHRIGQRRAVTAIRFATKDTIEQRMMELQDKKTAVFKGCVNGDVTELARLTQEDLLFLFRN